MKSELLLPHLIRSHASASGDDVVIEHVDGLTLTYAALQRRVDEWAAAYHGAGVREGDHVMTMLPASVEAWASWLALAWLGAVEVPIHTEYRGRMLQHVLAASQARAVVAASAYVPRFADLRWDPSTALVLADADEAPPEFPFWSTRREFFARRVAPPQRDPAPHDIACVIFTSGTTGPSKGVRVPWAQMYYAALSPPDAAIAPGEAYYAFWPPFHVGGKYALYLPIVKGGRVVLRDSFSASHFWEDVRRHRCSFALLVEPLVRFLLRQPAGADDRRHGLRYVMAAPLTPAVREFQDRFGVHVCTAFGMTEIGVPITATGDALVDWTSCGTVRQGPPGYEVRIVDEHDLPVPTGSVGELAIRTDEPWCLNAGYLGMPEATAHAWRNGWFHTGDGFKQNDAGELFFVDRLKDAIRRRGENISSLEVEHYVNEHPDVVESAAIGVASEHGEEDVMVFVVRTPGSTLDERGLLIDLARRMPRFMVPRFIAFRDALPKTEGTSRIRKSELRSGAPGIAWDREREGVVLQR